MPPSPPRRPGRPRPCSHRSCPGRTSCRRSSRAALAASMSMTPVTLASAPTMGVLGMSRLMVSSAMPEASTQATVTLSARPSAFLTASGGVQVLMMMVPSSETLGHVDDVEKRVVEDDDHIRVLDVAVDIDRFGLMRVNALMGAPMRSGPYSGIACMYWSEPSAVSATSLAAVTAPWPARACQRISVSCCTRLPFLTVPARGVSHRRASRTGPTRIWVPKRQTGPTGRSVAPTNR
jgi:hypothetical protein